MMKTNSFAAHLLGLELMHRFMRNLVHRSFEAADEHPADPKGVQAPFSPFACRLCS